MALPRHVYIEGTGATCIWNTWIWPSFLLEYLMAWSTWANFTCRAIALRTLPEGLFWNLSSLRWLFLQNNGLEELPSSVWARNHVDVTFPHGFKFWARSQWRPWRFRKVRNGLTKTVLEGLADMRKCLKGLFRRALGRLSEGSGKVPNGSAGSSILNRDAAGFSLAVFKMLRASHPAVADATWA